MEAPQAAAPSPTTSPAPAPAPDAQQRRRSLTERMSDFVHRVTHPHFRHNKERGAGGESPNHSQHAKQQTQPPPHQYGGAETQHDLAYESEANLAGAHAIPPFSLSHLWPGKKAQSGKVRPEQRQQEEEQQQQQQQKEEQQNSEQAPEPAVASDDTPAPVVVDAPPSSAHHPFDITPADNPATNTTTSTTATATEGSGHDEHHIQEPPAGLNQLQA
ncbi:hypothetical protein DFQ26_004510 [Actinomortierella ambigua]|nr:hypothetical protein DFQ26_004510 [Actinomortierella ambigua]